MTDSSQLIITVKEGNNTYSARCQGVTASATSGAEYAAYVCARKIVDTDIELVKQAEARPFYTKWLVKTKEKR
jgi:hypothetical protein